MEGLTISQVAKEANVNIETIRYYERRELIFEPPRTKSGYRKFPKEVVEDIKFIKRTQDIGFTLEEIKNLLAASNGDNFRSEEMRNFATSKMKEIETRILDLRQMKTLLDDLVEKCPGPGVSKGECPIINNFKGVN
ncbi:MerR family transcriptional regulator [Virgibacillus dakarensis]|uniref:MerR family transcriptional regulator n=1 Tax=Virgibacillus dakarensis TaxID=1917889 RepID=UPI000B443FD2|nr:MerR family transcriptional regulator [Virgibacillus dakarensis]